jgi:DNA-binding Lrp family transcriptional regulator
VGISEQLFNYRVKRLLSKKYISKFVPIINIDKMGLNLYRAMFRIENTGKKRMKKIDCTDTMGKRIFQQGSTIGSWDISVNFVCKNAKEFYEDLKSIKECYQDDLKEYTTMSLTSSLHFNRRFFLNGGQIRKFILYGGDPERIDLDEKDMLILRQLAEDAKISNFSISKNTGIAHSTIKSRIKQMEKKGVIKGYYAFLRTTLFGVIRKKVLIRCYDQLAMGQLLHDFALANPHVYVIEKMNGRWDYELLLEAFNYNEFQGLVQDLRNALAAVRFDYEMIDIAYNHDLNFNPILR